MCGKIEGHRANLRKVKSTTLDVLYSCILYFSYYAI